MENRISSSFAFCLSTEKALSRRKIDMAHSKLASGAATTVMQTDEGWIALAVDALAAAGKPRREQRRKALCEQVVSYLRPLVGDRNGTHVLLEGKQVAS